DVSAPDFAVVRDHTQTFAAAALTRYGDLSYTASEVPQRLVAARVSWQWFDVFGVRPRLGRAFRPEEDVPNAGNVVILSDQAWRRFWGADPSIVEKTILLDQLPYKVAGVMPPEFNWPARADVWVPFAMAPSEFDPGNRFNEGLFAVVRIRPGISFEQANAE